MTLTSEEIDRYKRHLVLHELGGQGQQKLKDSQVLVIGAGGLGSPIAIYLTLAGVGTIGIVDFDTVDVTNLQRQILHQNDDIGRPKVESAKETLLAYNPEGEWQDNIDAMTAALEPVRSVEVTTAVRGVKIGGLEIGEGQFISHDDVRTERRVVCVGHKVAKDLFGNSLNHELETQMELEAKGILASTRTEDYREGTLAFVEKRPPNFKGK